MHTTDIERMRVQIRRTADKAEEIIEDGDTIGDAGFDPSQSDKVLEKQRELVEELGQSLADFNELLNRAEHVESDRIEYSPASGSLSVSYDESTDEVTIEYTGSTTVPNSDITVTEAGKEISPFNGEDLTTDTNVTIDVSALSDGDEVSVEMPQNRVKTGHDIRSWEEILGQQGATAPSIDSGDIQMPEHNLTKNTRTLSRSAIVGQTDSTV